MRCWTRHRRTITINPYPQNHSRPNCYLNVDPSVKLLPECRAIIYKRTMILEDNYAICIRSCVFLEYCLNISDVTPSLTIQYCSPIISYNIVRIEAVNIHHSTVILGTNCSTSECFVVRNLSLENKLYN